MIKRDKAEMAAINKSEMATVELLNLINVLPDNLYNEAIQIHLVKSLKQFQRLLLKELLED